MPGWGKWAYFGLVGLLLVSQAGIALFTPLEPRTAQAAEAAAPTPTARPRAATRTPTPSPRSKASPSPNANTSTVSGVLQTATPRPAQSPAATTPGAQQGTGVAQPPPTRDRAARQPRAEPTLTPAPTAEPASAAESSGETAAEAELAENPSPAREPTPTLTPAPMPTATPTPRPVADWPTRARDEAGLSIHVLRYVGLILGVGREIGVDPAILAALMEVEGSGPDAVSPAGAAGLMQLMPDKLFETDDPFDPSTNLVRAAQYVRRLVASWDGDLAAIAGAYFGAIDQAGQVTDDSDGNLTGHQYVAAFAAAYQRWALAFNQPVRPIAIRPVIRQRGPTPEPELEPETALEVWESPERDRWYLYVERPQPAMPLTTA